MCSGDSIQSYDVCEHVKRIALYIKNNEIINFDNFSFQLIPTTHSIPDPAGIFFKTSSGNIFHTGDWKIDKNPVTGDPFSYGNYEYIKEEKIDLLVGDSTNAGVKEISRSESELDPSFDNLIKFNISVAVKPPVSSTFWLITSNMSLTKPRL